MREKDDLDVLVDSALATYADPGPESGLEDRVLAALQAERGSGEQRRWFEVLRSWWLPWAIAVPVVICVVVLWMSVGRTVHPPSTQQMARQPDRPQIPSLGAQGPGQPTAVTPGPAGARQAAKEPGTNVEGEESRPSAAKAATDMAALTARLKPCPFKAARLSATCKALPPSGAVVAGVKPCPLTKPICEGLSWLPGNLAKASVPKLDVFPAPQPLTTEERALVAAATRGSPAEREALAGSEEHADAPLSIADLNIPPLASSDEGKK